MEKADVLLLMLVAMGAYIIPFISRRLMLPSSVGEIFFGMAVAYFITPSATAEAPLHMLSWIGFMLLMYVAGLELDLDSLSAGNRRTVVSYTLYLLLIVLCSVGVAFLAGLPSFFILILMTCGMGLLFTVLKDLDIVKTRLGQQLIILGALGEIMSLVGITIVSLVQSSGTYKETLISILSITVFIAVVVGTIKLLKLFLWWYPEKNRFLMSVGTPSEIGVRANLANMFFFVTLAMFAGVEDILGAFFGGLIFAILFPDREQMLERLSSFGYGFLIPLFFIEVGTRFKFSDFFVPDVLLSASGLALLVLLIRVVASAPLLLVMPAKHLIFTALSQSFPLTIMVAVAAIGASMGLIDHRQTSVVILTVIITAVVYPWLMKLMGRRVLR